MSVESMREAFGKALVEAGKNNENIVVVDADLSKSTKTEYFKKQFPARFVDVGIAEQNLIGVSAGLASTGKNVFASSFAVFETGRAFEIIRNMVCMAKLNVKLCSTHAGLMTGPDGATHQSIEDISIMRALPNMRVLVPADAVEASAMISFMADEDGPMYMRMVRDDTKNIHYNDYEFKFGKAEKLREGDDVTIIACGPMVDLAIRAAKVMEIDNIRARVLNMSTIKPLDQEAIIESARLTKGIITVEDHSIIGGLGSAVAEIVCENLPCRVIRIGVRDVFGMSGTAEELYNYHGLNIDNIVDAAKNILDIDTDL